MGLHQIEIFKMRFFNFPLLIFLLSLGFADEQKTLTSRDYKKLFSQRFNTINKPIISDDEDFGPSGDDEEYSGASGDGEESDIFEPEVVVPKVTYEIPKGRKFSPPTSPKPKPTQKPTQKPPQVYPPGNSARSPFLLGNFLVILIALF